MEAVIKSLADRTWETPNGLRTHAIVDLAGQEVKVWGEPIEFDGYIPGDRVSLVQVNDHYRIAIPGNQPPPTPTRDRSEVAEFITRYAQLYADCHRAALAALPEGTPQEMIQSCTSSVYISVTRKMGL